MTTEPYKCAYLIKYFRLKRREEKREVMLVATSKFLAHDFNLFMIPWMQRQLRCCCVLLLVCSLWQGYETNIVSIIGFGAWCGNFHFRRRFYCRSFTYIVVVAAQRNISFPKLVLLLLLATLTPLYGKREIPNDELSPMKKQRSGSDQEDEEIVTNMEAQTQSESIALEFPFVPELLLTVFLSTYDEETLWEILSQEHIQQLEMWHEFSEAQNLIEDTDTIQMQNLCDDYARRFAKILLSTGTLTCKSEEIRLDELQRQDLILTARAYSTPESRLQ